MAVGVGAFSGLHWVMRPGNFFSQGEKKGKKLNMRKKGKERRKTKKEACAYQSAHLKKICCLQDGGLALALPGGAVVGE